MDTNTSENCNERLARAELERLNIFHDHDNALRGASEGARQHFWRAVTGNRAVPFTPTNLLDALDDLTPREHDITIMRHGLNSKYAHTLEAVAQRFAVTRNRVAALELRAKKKLSKMIDPTGAPSDEPFALCAEALEDATRRSKDSQWWTTRADVPKIDPAWYDLTVEQERAARRHEVEQEQLAIWRIWRAAPPNARQQALAMVGIDNLTFSQLCLMFVAFTARERETFELRTGIVGPGYTARELAKHLEIGPQELSPMIKNILKSLRQDHKLMTEQD